ncbi:MAG: S-methyl-5-thioribose-1-phosphate isomerase [Dehalococcoidia bacterium]|nr:S-methyl-5-thioribose-1-phosphate isomerase [Dehalococcoidia bacterium]
MSIVNFSTRQRRSFFLPSSPPGAVAAVEWRPCELRFLDQTRLPAEVAFVAARSYREVADAIRRLAVRGAPLIGIAAAYALALAAHDPGADLRAAADELIATRPTAVNLRWAVERCLRVAGEPRVRAEARAGIVEREAVAIHEEQIAADRRMGELGAALIPAGATVLTHCNTGALATGGIGTALGVIKTAHRQGKGIDVLVDETRPLLQGARLTAWELGREGIPYRVIVDAAAAGLIARGDVQAVVVGADRIAANGDVANKVGTYGLALAAAAHGVPFYVVAPDSTVDLDTADGAAIPIERRDADEVLAFGGAHTAVAGTGALNPAFDLTPARYVTAIVTERAVLRPPFVAALSSSARQAVLR